MGRCPATPGPLVANRAVVGAWERFKLVTNPDGSLGTSACVAMW
ncbi:hypothetical protein ACQP2P_44120 [Dactylosporangium sp. CA-139114]